jgi:hypothetical protein
VIIIGIPRRNRNPGKIPGIQNNAKDSAVKSDVSQRHTAVVACDRQQWRVTD